MNTRELVQSIQTHNWTAANEHVASLLAAKMAEQLAAERRTIRITEDTIVPRLPIDHSPETEKALEIAYRHRHLMSEPEQTSAIFDTDRLGRPQPSLAARAEANEYNQLHGMPAVDHEHYDPVPQEEQGAVADAYELLPMDDRGNPLVKAAYDQFFKETDDQWNWAVAHGMHFEPWTKPTSPYNTAQEVAADVANRHLWYSVTNDPQMDRFLAVHDYYGHSATGVGFGPRGEYNAWLTHSQMYSPVARVAMTTRTRGQQAWTHFGAHLYDANGKYLGQHPAEIPDAVLKYSLLPAWTAENRFTKK